MKFLIHCNQSFPYIIKKDNKYVLISREEFRELSKEKRLEIEKIMINKTIPIMCSYDKIELIKYSKENGYHTDSLSEEELIKQNYTTKEELYEYAKSGEAYVLYLTDFIFLKNKSIANYYKILYGRKIAISNPPQMMINATDDDDNKFALFCMKPENMINVLNGLKKIEIRKGILKELRNDW